MAKLLDPITQRDFRRGRLASSAVVDFIVPQNSVQNSQNVNFDEIIGAGKVRLGTTRYGFPIIGATTTAATFFTGDDAASDVYDVNWVAQTFQITTGLGYTTAATVKLTKTGTPTGLVKMSIYNTTGGVPSGSALASGYALATDISTGNFTFQLGPTTLLPATTYALVLSMTGGDNSNKIGWRYDNGGGYASGQQATSGNSGGTWTAQASNDNMFTVSIWTTGTAQQPKGFTTFVTSGETVNAMLAVYYSTLQTRPLIYYYTSATDWDISQFTGTTTTNKFRFAQLGNRMFEVNGDYMASTADGNVWAGGSAGSITGNVQYIEALKPSLIIRAKNRMLASGITVALSSGIIPRSRIYFSSIVDSNATPFITWDTDATTGDWIDINPDDGGDITALAETSTTVIIFKGNAMYRLNAITKTVDTENIYNIGAISQEGVTTCQGMVYFFSGQDIRRTDGTFPEQISRLGVQDFIDAITQSNWTNVALGHDDWNVYVSIGNVTLNENTSEERSYTNIVLKFSTRDESWSVHSYGDLQRRYTQYTDTTNGKMLQEIDTTGLAQWVNSANAASDNSKPIYYELETQHQEFGNLGHTKQLSDQVVVYVDNGGASTFQVKTDDNDYAQIPMSLADPINVGTDVNVTGNRFTFKWAGNIDETASIDFFNRPTFIGYHLPAITDLGVIKGK